LRMIVHSFHRFRVEHIKLVISSRRILWECSAYLDILVQLGVNVRVGANDNRICVCSLLVGCLKCSSVHVRALAHTWKRNSTSSSSTNVHTCCGGVMICRDFLSRFLSTTYTHHHSYLS
jgi:hypothetical protein